MICCCCYETGVVRMLCCFEKFVLEVCNFHSANYGAPRSKGALTCCQSGMPVGRPLTRIQAVLGCQEKLFVCTAGVFRHGSR